MQKECSADLFGFAHVEARGGGGVRRRQDHRGPCTNFKSCFPTSSG
jgi:hypothetical protein